MGGTGRERLEGLYAPTSPLRKNGWEAQRASIFALIKGGRGKIELKGRRILRVSVSPLFGNGWDGVMLDARGKLQERNVYEPERARRRQRASISNGGEGRLGRRQSL